MKKNQFSPRRAISALAFVALAALTLASCAVDGYDDESFSGGVSGQTLNSPAADSIVFTANADGSKTTITWPVVLGASGYRCSVYNVNDEQNPVAIIADTLVDGTSLVVPRSEDTNYSFSIQTIGNAQLNNTDAANATVASFSSYLPGFATIPDGADIAEWLSQNAIPEDSGEIALDLVPGGHYTLNANAEFGNAPVTLRTASENRATITVGEDASFVIKAGFRLKNLVIDAAGCTNPLILMNKEPNPATLDIRPAATSKGYYFIEDPVVIVNTLIDNLPDEVINDNKTQYVLSTFLVDNSIIHFNTATGHSSNGSYFNFYDQNGGINQLTLRNSTLYNSSDKQMRYIIRYSNGYRPARAGYDNMGVTFDHTTLYNLVPTGQSANYGGVRGAGKSCTITLDHNIVVNTSHNQFVRRLLGGDPWTGDVEKAFNSNTYVYDGQDAWTMPDPNDVSTWTGEISYDQSGTIISGDPGFADADKGDFTVSSGAQIAAKSGDPRWLK